VSRHHAELRSPTGSTRSPTRQPQRTFVNGQRVTTGPDRTDLVSIGSSTFRLTGGELRQFVDDGNITFNAQELVVGSGARCR
jgi:hypothetical protein